MNDNLQQKKFYQTTWFTIVMLVLFYPVGIFFLWKNKIFNKVGRGIITLLFIPIIFINIFFWIGMFSGESKSLSQVSDKQVEKRNEETNTESKEAESKNESKENANFKIEDDNSQISSYNNIEKSSDLIKDVYALYKNSSEPKTEKFLRNPDEFTGKNIMYSGKIIQVIEGNNEYPTNIIIENSIDGEMVNILYDRKEGQSRYLVDDYITVLGTFDRIEGMQNLMGQQVPVPIIDCNYMDFSYNIKRIINGCKAMDSISVNYKLEMTDQTYDEPNGKSGSLFKVYYKDSKKYDSRLLYSNGVNTSWYIPETESITEYFFSEQL
ncbi:hypothetical protein [uncultured Clostridium sp.]|uniref:hypothetical protein n=1 Tax=uncultured Clostridium sp. TaxID=59620 RepID=UPI0028ECCC5B|nr:hypothetical protein [uncultured Clostridium sp.]